MELGTASSADLRRSGDHNRERGNRGSREKQSENLIAEAGNLELGTERLNELVTFCAASSVGRFFEARPNGTGVEPDNPKVLGFLAKRHVTNRPVSGVVVGPHALLGKKIMI